MRPANLEERRSFAEPREGYGGQANASDFVDQALARWMQVDGRARLLVDQDLRTLWASPAADAILSEFQSLFIHNGQIRARENRMDRELRDLVAGASSDISIRCINDFRTGEHIVLTAMRVAMPSVDLVGLTLQRAGENFVFRLADLQEAFGFTRTERRVAYHLMCGRTAEGTAQHLGVSVETVRTHIKRGYSKLGVSSREAFFHRLMPMAVLMA